MFLGIDNPGIRGTISLALFPATFEDSRAGWARHRFSSPRLRDEVEIKLVRNMNYIVERWYSYPAAGLTQRPRSYTLRNGAWLLSK